MNIKLVIACALAVVVALGGFYLYGTVSQAPAQPAGGQTSLANPASTNCVTTLKGTLEIKDTAEGAVGICHLPDGRSCEEWALFRDNTCTDPTATSTPTGAPITPSGDGTGVSDNFALGIDGTTQLGSYLIAYNGATVYTYANDKAGVSNCTGQCAVNWPPYIVPAGSRLNLQMGVKGTIATIVRADGTTQVTYKGMPLYFYAKDTVSGDTKGQGVGGVWYVVKP